MTRAIHIEIDALFLLILLVIGHQIDRSVSKQMNRILFRMTVYGIIWTLFLDILWMLVEGEQFPGAIAINKVVNALFLGAGVLMGSVWYLYVLDALGYRIRKRLVWIVLFPGLFFLVLNLLSIHTGWTFTINEQNVYVRGPLFWLQTIGALLMLFISLIHILIRMMRKGGNTREVRKLLRFYIVPVIGTLAALPYSGMPGTWTCAAVSIILIYMDDQDGEILRDSLTGLNNRKTLESTFADYSRLAAPQRSLYLFMMDLNKVKEINDQFGHSTGDDALIIAARLLLKSVTGMKAIVARYGGDEFLVMTFFESDEEALAYKTRVRESFVQYDRENALPYELSISVGCSRYRPGQKLAELIKAADDDLYQEKRSRIASR